MAALLEHTVMPSGGDYTSLDACIDHLVATHPNLVTADVYAEVKIDGTWSSADTAAVTIDGLTTDATRYLLVYAATAARHAGIWSTSKYNLTITDGGALTSSAAYVKIDGLQIMVNTASAARITITLSGSKTSGQNQTEISNCIIRGHGNASYRDRGIYIGGANILLKAWNLIIYGINTGANSEGIKVDNYGGEAAYVYSSTVISGYEGLTKASGVTLVCKNVYASRGGEQAAYSGSPTLTTCASSDATGTAGLQNIAVDTDTFVNVSAGTEDFHLAADGLSPLQGVGTDTSGDAAPMNFTTDIDGDTRS